MLAIDLTNKDVQDIRHLRESLSNGSVNINMLNGLLSSLGGKIEKPSGEGRKKRQVHKNGRVARHLDHLISKPIKKAS